MSGIAGVFLRSHMGWLEPRDHIGIIGALGHRAARGFSWQTNPSHTVLLMHAHSSPACSVRAARPKDQGHAKPLLHVDGWMQGDQDLEKAFRQTGPSMFASLKGEFALALFDESENAVFLVRDKLGTRSLYYAEAPPAVVFGSEIKAILSHPEIKADFDMANLRAAMSGLVLPGATIFDKVAEVPPGHYVKITGDSIALTRYWEPDIGRFDEFANPESVCEELASRLDSAVSTRAAKESRTGLFLSAGISSGSLAHSIAQETSGVQQSYTIKFGDQQSEEVVTAARIASQCGLAHEVVPVSAQALADNFQVSLWHGERPVHDMSGSAWYILAKGCAGSADTIVSGMGAAEVLAGTAAHRHQCLLDAHRRTGDAAMASSIRQLLRREAGAHGLVPLKKYKGLGPLETIFGFYPYAAMRALRSERLLRYVLSEDMQSASPLETTFERFAASLPAAELRAAGSAEASRYICLYRQLPETRLMQGGDRMTMAHSLASTTPFLDEDLVALASALPLRMLVDERKGQLPLRQAMAKRLPRYVCEAAEQRFAVPPETTGSLLDLTLCKLALSKSAVDDAGVFRAERLEQLVKVMKFIPAGTRLGQELRSVLALAVSVQFLHELFAASFMASASNFMSSASRKRLDAFLSEAGNGVQT